MQLSFKRQPNGPTRLCDLRLGENAVIDRLDLASDEKERLMELGFLPGAHVSAARAAPGGDPRVYRVDGSEFAIRRDTAARLFLRSVPHPQDQV